MDIKKLSDEEIAELAVNLHDEMNARKQKAQAVINKELIGKCYKTRNCYSCPQTEDDYWLLYIKVTGSNEYGELVGIQMQVDCDGKVEVEHRRLHISDSYQQITRSEWQDAADDILEQAKLIIER